jgi:hypothetical protein
MADLNDGESIEMKGSGAKPYILKNVVGSHLMRWAKNPIIQG